MARRAGVLLVVSALAAGVAALGHAAATSTPLRVSLKFPAACTGAVYRIGVTPSGRAAGVTVKNAAAGNALPAEIRAVAAVATAGKGTYIFVFMNNLAQRKVSAHTDQPDALEMIVAGAHSLRSNTNTFLSKRIVALKRRDLTGEEIQTGDNVYKVLKWAKLGLFASPPSAVAKFSAAPASDKSAHCG